MDNKPSYDELKTKCDDFQAQIIRFLKVEQDLVNARSKLDRDLSRFKSIQIYSQKVLGAKDIEEFSKITIESIVETFEVECSAFFIYNKDRNFLTAQSHFGFDDEAFIDCQIDGEWISSRGFLKNGKVIIEQVEADSMPFGKAGLYKVILSPYYDEEGNFHGMLMGGVSRLKRAYYDDISEQLIPSFMVFTQQMNAMLQNFEVKRFLDMKIKERTAQVIQQKEELQSTLENLQKTQEQLIESEKMAAIGGLVAGVAHEINTPVGIGVTAISNLLDDIRKIAGLFEKDEISRKDFKEFLQSSYDISKLIQRNLERTAELVQSFKQVSTDQATEQQRVFAFREYLNDILLSLQPKFSGKKIEFKIECDDKLKLNSYPGVFAQIFTNLLLNSLQHGFPEKETGTIGIKAEINNELLKIQYSDDGAGISKKDLPHIFEPFYTSDQHRGTGLGLNIIYNLIKQKLHGTITCESESGKGVLFKIEVPIK
jgi:signal transduction histidine kinase